MKRLATLTSFIFHPVVFALLMPFLFMYHRNGDISDGLKWMIFSSLFLFLALIIFFLLRPTQFLTDFDLSNKKDRPIFYTIALVCAILYFLVSVLFKGLFFPLSIASLGIILGIVVLELVNFYEKASIHGAVACAYVVTFSLFYGWPAFLLTFWIPLAVGWSRLYLHKHTLREFMLGSALGILVTLLCFAVARILVYN